MHTSRSETIELLAGLSGVRFCETLPQRNSKLDGGRSTGCIAGGNDVNRLVDLNCHKFLSSGSVSRWMSEWKLCHEARYKQTADIGVQCNIGYQEKSHTSKRNIPVPLASNTTTIQPAEQVNEPTSSIASVLPPEEESTKRWLFDTSYVYLEDTKASGEDAANFLSASFMTTTNTTETQTSEMDLYRRASYLEEYAAKRVFQMKDDKASGSATCSKVFTDLKHRIFRLFVCCKVCCCGNSCRCTRRRPRDSIKRKSKTSRTLKKFSFKEENMEDLEEFSDRRSHKESEKVDIFPDEKKITLLNDLDGEEVDVPIDTRQNVKRSIPRRKAGMDLPNDMKLKKRPTNGELIIVTTTYV